MSMDHGKLPMYEAGLADVDATPRRGRQPSTARLAALAVAAGLIGAGLGGGAIAQKEKDPDTTVRGAGGGPHAEAVSPSDSKAGIRTPSDLKKKRRLRLREKRNLPAVQDKLPAVQGRRMLPAVQQRELKLLLRDALRTGNSRLALKRHPKLKLNPGHKKALLRMTKRDWAQLRRLKAKLRPLQLNISPR